MTQRINILDTDSLVPYMTEEERMLIAESVAAGIWYIDLDGERYNELWAKSVFRNVATEAIVEYAMKKGIIKHKQ